MYIIELIMQVFKRKSKVQSTYEPLDNLETDGLIENSDDCNHLFLPLDSSNEYFGCKYCGLVVPKEELKNKNIFEKKII